MGDTLTRNTSEVVTEAIAAMYYYFLHIPQTINYSFVHCNIMYSIRILGGLGADVSELNIPPQSL